MEELQCTGQAKAVRKLQGKRLGQLQPLPQTLRAWALLQLDGPPKVCRAASASLASAAKNKSFREKVCMRGGGSLLAVGVGGGGREAFSLRKDQGVCDGGCICRKVFGFRDAPNMNTALLTPSPSAAPGLGGTTCHPSPSPQCF